MSQLLSQIASTKMMAHHRPWPRAAVNAEGWRFAADQLAAGRWVLVGLWGERHAVHMAVRDEAANESAVLSFAAADGRFPSVARLHPPALRLERTIQDLFGLIAEDAPDGRPWLDHGRWGMSAPLGTHGPANAARYPFLPVEGDSLTEIAVGPVHAGIIEPGFFRFTTNGEAVVRLEQRFGYTHKGLENLMAGATLARGIDLAGRACGDSTVAYSYAFARAAEEALEVNVPPRAVWLRALMAELERMANHFGDFGAICNDAGFALMLAQCSAVRERVLRTSDTAFGHRMMRDCLAVGGVARDLAAEGITAIHALLDETGRALPRLKELYDNTASLQDRTVSTGIVTAALAKQYAAGGYVGRASGRSFDARQAPSYAPYDRLRFEVPVRQAGDADARVWIRIEEIEQSRALIRQILDHLPAGDIRAELRLPGEAREGVALVEGFRGDVFAWLRVNADGTLARAHLRDPSWFQWPLLEAAIENNIVADFPLCNKSFNCAYSGTDL
ncbi:MAG: NADH-quinone oxidoreductase subunit C [Alphaproteobacteria bacterium]|nr:NADH-quinone oxidoreductase subunit C [Alphaproteobacteria bacterium]MDE2074757.1 NADH-quinone oxidoreductase subunit C [Alphaproteobacteria bacterium]